MTIIAWYYKYLWMNVYFIFAVVIFCTKNIKEIALHLEFTFIKTIYRKYNYLCQEDGDIKFSLHTKPTESLFCTSNRLATTLPFPTLKVFPNDKLPDEESVFLTKSLRKMSKSHLWIKGFKVSPSKVFCH